MKMLTILITIAWINPLALTHAQDTDIWSTLATESPADPWQSDTTVVADQLSDWHAAEAQAEAERIAITKAKAQAESKRQAIAQANADFHKCNAEVKQWVANNTPKFKGGLSQTIASASYVLSNIYTLNRESTRATSLHQLGNSQTDSYNEKVNKFNAKLDRLAAAETRQLADCTSIRDESLP